MDLDTIESKPFTACKVKTDIPLFGIHVAGSTFENAVEGTEKWKFLSAEGCAFRVFKYIFHSILSPQRQMRFRGAYSFYK